MKPDKSVWKCPELRMSWIKVFMVIIQSMFWVCRVILLTCSLSHTCVCSSYFKGCVYESAVRCVCVCVSDYRIMPIRSVWADDQSFKWVYWYVIYFYLLLCGEQNTRAQQSRAEVGASVLALSSLSASVSLYLFVCLSLSLSTLLFCPWICCGSVVWTW